MNKASGWSPAIASVKRMEDEASGSTRSGSHHNGTPLCWIREACLIFNLYFLNLYEFRSYFDERGYFLTRSARTRLHRRQSQTHHKLFVNLSHDLCFILFNVSPLLVVRTIQKVGLEHKNIFKNKKCIAEEVKATTIKADAAAESSASACKPCSSDKRECADCGVSTADLFGLVATSVLLLQA